MPLVGAERTGLPSAFEPVLFHSSSASTSTGMTVSGSSGRAKRSMTQAKVAEQMATKPQARRASEAGTSAVVKGFSHIPHGNTALSVKADEARLASITDEKERKRLKRLLRNRVSAQQARERKKAYLSSLEQQEDEKEHRMNELENRARILERENQMLRQVIQTVTRKSVPANPQPGDFAM